MKFWNRLRWFALISFLLILVVLWFSGPTGSSTDLISAPKFSVTP
jgi:hypothetical protein